MTMTEKKTVELSADVLNFLGLIVSQQSVSAAQADFDEAAELLGRTRRELLAALDYSSDASSSAISSSRDSGGS